MPKSAYEKVIDWAAQFALPVDGSQLERREFADAFELDEWLVAALAPAGFESFMEQGRPPSEYLPDIISASLSLVNDRHFALDAVSTTDDWLTATATIISGRERWEIFIDGVGDSDWLPGDLLHKLELFSREQCGKVLFSIHGEEPFIMLYLSRDAIAELESIRRALPRPEWMEEAWMQEEPRPR